MKSAEQKRKPPQPRFSEFKNFILALFKRRVFLYFVALGLPASLVPILIPEFSLLIIFGMGVLFAGFVWAAFMEHRELLGAYQRAVITVPREKNKRSGIAISFVADNEYRYSIGDPYAGQNLHLTRMQNNRDLTCHYDKRGIFFINGEVYYMMAGGSLEINFQLFNSGDVPIDIRSVYVDDSLDLSHLRVYLEGIYLRGNKVRFPLHLEMGGFVTLQTRHRISPGMGSSEALFAVDMRSLPKTILYDVVVNTSNGNGKRQSYVAELATSSKPLVDLYINQWQEYDQQEFLVLAGYSPAADM